MYGLRYVVDRCGVITGPWQMGKVDQGVFALWMGRHYFKRPLKYIGYGGTGKQVRDFVDVDELCDLVLRQLDQHRRAAAPRLQRRRRPRARASRCARRPRCARRSRATEWRSSACRRTVLPTSAST